MALLRLIVFFCLTAWSFLHAEEQAPWAAQLKASLIPEKTKIFLSEPVFLTFRVENNSPHNLSFQSGGDHRNAIGRPDSFTFTVTDASGNKLPIRDAGTNMGGISTVDTVPSQQPHNSKLFLPDWVTFSQPGTYTIEVARTFPISITGKDAFEKKKFFSLPLKASATIEVVPLDDGELGNMIDALGKQIMSGRVDEAEEASKIMASIQDPRTIPWWNKAVVSREYSLMFRAIVALGKYREDLALAGLQQAARTGINDVVADASRPELRAELADAIRITAAQALAQSPHPGAMDVLLSLSEDPNPEVRITLVRHLGKKRDSISLKALEVMALDPDKNVSEEAWRALKQISRAIPTTSPSKQ